MNRRLIDLGRIEQRLAELGEIGATPDGGVNRLAFSTEDAEARQTVIRWFEDLGLEVRIDTAGNIIGRREGLQPELPPLMLGSHIDSVPNGGRYDGCLGVVAAIEVVEILNQMKIQTEAPIEVVSFQMEESSRFALAMFGSRVMAGSFQKEILNRKDKEGLTLSDCLRIFGLNPDHLPRAERKTGDIAGFLELHIDQGKILQQLDKPVGLVTGIAAPSRWLCRLQGESCHSGATLPEHRRDALVAAAEVILAVEKTAMAYRERQLVATIGTLDLKPGVINVIPGEVLLGLDIRGIHRDAIESFVQEIRALTEHVAARRSIEVDWQLLSQDEPALTDDAWLGIMEEQCRRLEIPYDRMISLPAHDALQISRLAPVGMILVRNESGVSHSPSERINRDDIAVGVELYCRVALSWLGVDLASRETERSAG